jgi:5-formyltetrahydrofolate cyclo-ligase
MIDIAEQKSAAREAGYHHRKAAHAAAGDAVARATERLLAAIGPARGRVISGYLPIRTEIDPRPAMKALHAAGARICVPVIDGKGRPLKFREWTPTAPLVAGPFGARVPEGGAWLEPEILITPLIAFTRACYRLGYGGGFYDRTLAMLVDRRPTLALGFAFAAQEVAELPLEPTDIQLDGVVTEWEFIRRVD